MAKGQAQATVPQDVEEILGQGFETLAEKVASMVDREYLPSALVLIRLAWLQAEACKAKESKFLWKALWPSDFATLANYWPGGCENWEMFHENVTSVLMEQGIISFSPGRKGENDRKPKPPRVRLGQASSTFHGQDDLDNILAKTLKTLARKQKKKKTNR